MHLKPILTGLPWLMFAIPGSAQQLPQQVQQHLADCVQTTDTARRLACFDRFATVYGVAPVPARDAAEVTADEVTGTATASGHQPADAPPTGQGEPVISGRAAADSTDYSMAQHWELDSKHRHGIFVFRPHRPNYLIAARTYRPNDAPYEPFRPADFTGRLSHAELQFQLGFKMKVVETAFELPADVWFGFTQNSFWQAGNREASSPFRETNYQPELMVVTPLHFSLLGADVKFLNLGFNHQSNGQTSTLSRSWNRAYAQVGLERGPLSMTVRVWRRFKESPEDDNNPDIIDYMGRGDLTATYRVNGHAFSALLRHNFRTDKGATQLSWAFPLAGPLKGYIHWFSGYGQSLIDYNYFQRTLGAGVVVAY